MKEIFLIFAYMAMWVGLSGYIAALAYRQRKLADRIDVMKQRFKHKES